MFGYLALHGALVRSDGDEVTPVRLRQSVGERDDVAEPAADGEFGSRTAEFGEVGAGGDKVGVEGGGSAGDERGGGVLLLLGVGDGDVEGVGSGSGSGGEFVGLGVVVALVMAVGGGGGGRGGIEGGEDGFGVGGWVEEGVEGRFGGLGLGLGGGE